MCVPRTEKSAGHKRHYCISEQLRLASWEGLTWWFQIEPSLLRSSGVRRTYWLVSIVLPWKSQSGMELEPTPGGRDGHRQVLERLRQQSTALLCSPKRACPPPPRSSPASSPFTAGLTLVGLDERVLPLEVFTVAVGYIRSHRPQQQKQVQKCSGARAGARKPRPPWAPLTPAPAPTPKPGLGRHAPFLSATSALRLPPSGRLF